jgi:hypothetical protein
MCKIAFFGVIFFSSAGKKKVTPGKDALFTIEKKRQHIPGTPVSIHPLNSITLSAHFPYAGADSTDPKPFSAKWSYFAVLTDAPVEVSNGVSTMTSSGSNLSLGKATRSGYYKCVFQLDGKDVAKFTFFLGKLIICSILLIRPAPFHHPVDPET